MSTSRNVYLLDPARTSITVHTTAEGLLSRFAHDLDIAVREVAGHARHAEVSTAELEVPVDSLHVLGVARRGRVDASALSLQDVAEIQRQLREEVLGGAHTVHVSVRVEGGEAVLTVVLPTGTARFVTRGDVLPTPDGAELAAHGSVDLSLQSLGVAPVKGPLGAFRVGDRVRVDFRATFRRPRGTPP